MFRALSRYLAGVKKATTPRTIDYGEELMLWDFRNEETIKQWSCISDEEIDGHSRAVFQSNKKGTGALFQGVLNTQISPGSIMKYSGYCAIRSKPIQAGWFESDRVDVSEFDAFELRVRGDGRKFIANVQSPGLARKDDVWQCFMFTRGGPEWENITLPFGDFFITHRGYMQDHQMSFPRQSLYTFGLLLADRLIGPFSLELQYIKVVRTLVHQPDSRISW